MLGGWWVAWLSSFLIAPTVFIVESCDSFTLLLLFERVCETKFAANREQISYLVVLGGTRDDDDDDDDDSFCNSAITSYIRLIGILDMLLQTKVLLIRKMWFLMKNEVKKVMIMMDDSVSLWTFLFRDCRFVVVIKVLLLLLRTFTTTGQERYDLGTTLREVRSMATFDDSLLLLIITVLCFYSLMKNQE